MLHVVSHEEHFWKKGWRREETILRSQQLNSPGCRVCDCNGVTTFQEHDAFFTVPSAASDCRPRVAHDGSVLAPLAFDIRGLFIVIFLTSLLRGVSL